MRWFFQLRNLALEPSRAAVLCDHVTVTRGSARIVRPTKEPGLIESEIQCERHGPQPKAYVCRHIVESLRDRQPRGFWFESDDSSPRPDAWCTGCNEHLPTTGGVWTEEAEASLEITLLCGKCYDDAKALNGHRET